jgi:hypothetical protein
MRAAARAAALGNVAIARNPDRCPQALGKNCLPVESVARRRLGLAPWLVAGVSVEISSPGWLPLGPFPHRHPPGPYYLLGS